MWPSSELAAAVRTISIHTRGCRRLAWRRSATSIRLRGRSRRRRFSKIPARKAKEFEDLRGVFADPGIEAVSIATPNHWHALATIWACKAGKDVYCEKPACYNIHEGQQMIKVGARNQAHGADRLPAPQHALEDKAIQSLQDGIIGRSIWPKGCASSAAPRSGTSQTAPRARFELGSVSLGPAPMRRTTSCATNTTGTGSGTPATAISATRACMRWAWPAGVGRS